MTLRAKVLTVSDSTAAGTRIDQSGPALVERLVALGYEVVDQRVAPDGAASVADAIAALAEGFSGLLITTGGTGFSPSDETPEGTLRVLDRLAPGIAEAARAVSPLGALSRGVAGTRGKCLVFNVPGSTRGALESLDAVAQVLPHALQLLRGEHLH